LVILESVVMSHNNYSTEDLQLRGSVSQRING
jgi:hypothetical protein